MALAQRGRKAKMECIRITDNKGLADLLEDDELCTRGVTAIAITSRPGTARLLRAMADDREDTVHLVLHEAIDTETPSHPRAFTQAMARETLAALRGAELWGDVVAFACDDGQSRSPAIAAAWARISGLDDLEYWLDPRKYYPNVLVYSRMLEAAGFEHVAERAVIRKLVKEAVLAGAVRGGNGGDGPNRFDRKLSHLGWDLFESRDSDKPESCEGEG